jgi:hypothetical protein
MTYATDPFDALENHKEAVEVAVDAFYNTLKANKPDAVPAPVAMAALLVALAESIKNNTNPSPLWAREMAARLIQLVDAFTGDDAPWPTTGYAI